MIEEYDIIELIEEMTPDLRIGTQGTVLMIYPASPMAYEVEFVNEVGETLAVRTVRETQIRKIGEIGMSSSC